ncbi:hypothetical protein JTE90_013109 [Oedothorax gibbosus]|uniref:Uncharacterized protein n=1 Tax=Oedothorax gibbosus TaxID=931172 RepID=A0AAV6TI87_9ARAC|nr:hypothetical protein JTE90_013109 [Oedothorax gibbosus]
MVGGFPPGERNTHRAAAGWLGVFFFRREEHSPRGGGMVGGVFPPARGTLTARRRDGWGCFSPGERNTHRAAAGWLGVFFPRREEHSPRGGGMVGGVFPPARGTLTARRRDGWGCFSPGERNTHRAAAGWLGVFFPRREEHSPRGGGMVGGVFPPARGTLTARRRDGWGCFSPGERNTHRAAAGWLGVFFPRREEHSPRGGGMVGGVFPPARGTLTARRRDGWGCFSPGERNTHRAAAGWLGVFFPRREEHSPRGGGMVGVVFPPARGTLTARRRDGWGCFSPGERNTHRAAAGWLGVFFPRREEHSPRGGGMVGGVFPPARGTLTARRRDGWGSFSPGERNTHRAAAGWLGVFFPRREEHSPRGGGMVGGVFPPARGTLTARRRDGWGCFFPRREEHSPRGGGMVGGVFPPGERNTHRAAAGWLGVFFPRREEHSPRTVVGKG